MTITDSVYEQQRIVNQQLREQLASAEAEAKQLRKALVLASDVLCEHHEQLLKGFRYDIPCLVCAESDSFKNLEAALASAALLTPSATAGISSRPVVVCLCGSTKFKQEFIYANFRETMAGKIVLSVGWFGHADGNVYTPTPIEKSELDELHKRKIDLADEVLVINVGGYIGASTRSEIEYAEKHGKLVRWMVVPDMEGAK